MRPFPPSTKLNPRIDTLSASGCEINAHSNIKPCRGNSLQLCTWGEGGNSSHGVQIDLGVYFTDTGICESVESEGWPPNNHTSYQFREAEEDEKANWDGKGWRTINKVSLRPAQLREETEWRKNTSGKVRTKNGLHG